MTYATLAFDRATVRRIDADGRLHVAVSNITKANVCPYFGREIPGAAALGLDPDRTYQLYRDPGELAKAASTFNNIPLLDSHVPVHADAPQKESVVGATGSETVFEAPYLKNSLVVWDSSAIAGIQTGEQRELSAAYRYVADMTPGVTPEGVPYDGRMTEIAGNHVALVPVGRAGADVLVSDSLPEELAPMKPSKAAAAKAALGALLLPQLAQDSAPKINTLMKGATTAEKLAQDAAKAFPDAGLDVAKLAKAIQYAMDEADEDETKKPETANDEDEDEKDDDKKAQDEDDEDEDEKDDKPAMDAATIAQIRSSAVAEAKAHAKALREAEALVRPLVGEVVAMDSAEDVHRYAMDKLGIPHQGVHPSAFPALLSMHSQRATPEPRVALDSAHSSDFAKRYPTAGKVMKV